MEFEQLFAKRAGQIKPGLERIARSYDFLARPAAEIPAVLVGGTNGKGSTSAFLWSLLSYGGRAVGLYTSPHLVAFSERFQLSGRTIDDGDVKILWERLQAQLPADYYAELSFFEIATLIAFMLFAERKAEFQVLEVGLGGRWDATNISDPLLSILVSVSRDHQEYLGDDLLGILDEKLGIMRPDRPFFWGDQGEICQQPGYMQRIESRARELNSPLYCRGREFFVDEQGLHLRLPALPDLTLPWRGKVALLPHFLRNNLAIAAAAYHCYSQQNRSWQSLSDIWTDWCEGHSQAPVTLIGRSQRILSPFDLGRRRLLVDVCHNPDGARAFVEAIRNMGLRIPIPGLVSILADKDFDSILDVLRSVLHPVILFGIEHERSWKPELLAARHRDLAFHPHLEDAWAAAQTATDEPLAICGSVLAVGHTLKLMKVSPKELTLARIIGGDWTLPASTADSAASPRSGCPEL